MVASTEYPSSNRVVAFYTIPPACAMLFKRKTLSLG